MMRLPIAVSFRLLVLLALAERAAANMIVNPWTTRGKPPPERVPCTETAECMAYEGTACCDAVAPGTCTTSCTTGYDEVEPDGTVLKDLQADGKYSCMEKIKPGNDGVPDNACNDPKAHGFVECWSAAAQADRGSDEELSRYCSTRNRPGGKYWTGAQTSLPPASSPPPTPPPPPPLPPPDFSNTAAGQITYGAGALIFLLVICLLSYHVHVRAKVDVDRIKEWASVGGKMRKGAGAALTFFVRWICVESGLEAVVEFFNGIAAANAKLGSPSSFYIAVSINVVMISLELLEVRLTRKHGGEQTPWDKFMFGQWTDATRKNYYAKYSARMVLGIHLFINIAVLPSVISISEFQRSETDTDVTFYNLQVQSAMFLAGFNHWKFVMGMFMLVDTVGVTLLEPLLAALPKRLQRLRVGPLAAPGQYSARDWAITNIVCVVGSCVYFCLFFKQITFCGWSPDAFPWNLPEYPSKDRYCDNMPQTVFEDTAQGFSEGNNRVGSFIGFFAMIAMPLSFTCAVLRLARKLPSWGEPPASQTEAESDKAIANPPGVAAKVAPHDTQDV